MSIDLHDKLHISIGMIIKSPQHSGGWTGPPLKIISEMIVGWSGLPTPWTHFSNIDFPYPEIISAITDPHFEIISAGVLEPQNHF